MNGDEFITEFEQLKATHLLTTEEHEMALRRAYGFALERGSGELPQYDPFAATGDFWRAAGEVIALRQLT